MVRLKLMNLKKNSPDSPKLLIIWSHYYQALAEKQLASCRSLLSTSGMEAQVETVEAGAYEIPAVMQYYHQHQPFLKYSQ